MVSKGVKFGTIHSYNDLNLILSSVDIPPASPKTNYYDIPGGDGSGDLSEALGEIKYNDRDCTFTFTMNPADGLTDADFELKKTKVSNALNGLKCNIVLDKDSNYYYVGRCTVSEYLSDKRLRQIIVTAKVFPYKYKKNVTVVDADLTSTGTTLTLTNSRKSVVPEIICTADNTHVVSGETEVMLAAGTHKILNFQLKQGNKVFTVSGSGKITFKYQEADL